MGLDIYFFKRKQVEEEPTIETLKTGLDDALFFITNRDDFNAEYIEEFVNRQKEKFGLDRKVGYLRKVNFIYRYFGNRIDTNTMECEVTKEDLKDIIAKCKEVLEKEDEETSKNLLPTCSGFFFGSTDYDSYYYDDVKEVLELSTNLLADLHEDETLVVYFSY